VRAIHAARQRSTGSSYEPFHPANELSGIGECLPDFIFCRACVKAVLVILPEAPHMVELQDKTVL